MLLHQKHVTRYHVASPSRVTHPLKRTDSLYLSQYVKSDIKTAKIVTFFQVPNCALDIIGHTLYPNSSEGLEKCNDLSVLRGVYSDTTQLLNSSS